MENRKLTDALSNIDEDLVENASEKNIKKKSGKRIPAMRYAALVASFFIIVASACVGYYMQKFPSIIMPPDNEIETLEGGRTEETETETELYTTTTVMATTTKSTTTTTVAATEAIETTTAATIAATEVSTTADVNYVTQIEYFDSNNTYIVYSFDFTQDNGNVRIYPDKLFGKIIKSTNSDNSEIEYISINKSINAEMMLESYFAKYNELPVINGCSVSSLLKDGIEMATDSFFINCVLIDYAKENSISSNKIITISIDEMSILEDGEYIAYAMIGVEDDKSTPNVIQEYRVTAGFIIDISGAN